MDALRSVVASEVAQDVSRFCELPLRFFRVAVTGLRVKVAEMLSDAFFIDVRFARPELLTSSSSVSCFC
jgi:hypothetical protein